MSTVYHLPSVDPFVVYGASRSHGSSDPSPPPSSAASAASVPGRRRFLLPLPADDAPSSGRDLSDPLGPSDPPGRPARRGRTPRRLDSARTVQRPPPPPPRPSPRHPPPFPSSPPSVHQEAWVAWAISCDLPQDSTSGQQDWRYL
jgi:hypothetical protein